MDESEILKGLRPVCLCRGIRQKSVERLMARGIRDLDELMRLSGAGTGSCGGRRCRLRIIELLREAGET